MGKKRERVVVITNTKDYEKVDYKTVWDNIIKDKLEKKYGKIK